MKAVLFAVAAAIALAGCSGGGPVVADAANATTIGNLDKQSRAGHEN
jgi:hypothetical protein